jgi:GTP-binding protein Era
MFKSGFVAIVGSPNAGKSTFLNTVIGKKVSIVSDKVQTTRDMIRGIYTTDDIQIVFLDTPGFHQPQNKLHVYMNRQIDMSLMNIDVIVYMLDAKYGLGKKEQVNLKKLSEFKNIPLICVVNKIDLLPQQRVSAIVKEINELGLFSDVICASMKEKFNQESIIRSIKGYLKETTEFFIEEIIREKILYHTDQEVPHSIGVKVKDIYDQQEVLVIEAEIYVERDSQKGIIIGKAGSMLKAIGKASRLELKAEFKQPVHLELHVKVLSKWGQNQELLSQVGYDLE